MNEDALAQVRDQAVALARLAREEDLGSGDVTGALLEIGEAAGEFDLIAREPCVLAGRAIAAEILHVYDGGLDIDWVGAAVDGARIESAPVALARIAGSYASILAGERVLLNFLQRLCGIATLTRMYVDAVAGTGAMILDTRKTTPGWRLLEKYAVRCGKGHNHRMGLHDAVLIKDNHLANVPDQRLAHHVFELLSRAEQLTPRPKFIEVEVDSLGQLEQLLKVVGIDVILLDNFHLDQMRDAVAMRNALCSGGKPALEASGGITLDAVRAVAETGVERISVGALTHSATAVDLAMDKVGTPGG